MLWRVAALDAFGAVVEITVEGETRTDAEAEAARGFGAGAAIYRIAPLSPANAVRRPQKEGRGYGPNH